MTRGPQTLDRDVYTVDARGDVKLLNPCSAAMRRSKRLYQQLKLSSRTNLPARACRHCGSECCRPGRRPAT